MASVKHSSRYNAYDLRSSNSSQVSGPSSSAEFRQKQSATRSNGSYSGSGSGSDFRLGATRRKESSSSGAVAKARVEVRVDQSNLASIVKKFMEKRSAAKEAKRLFLPADLVAEDLKKAARKGTTSGIGGLHKKLFGKGSGGGGKSEMKALTEVKTNTRTLAMVLRSERELLGRNKELEEEVKALNLMIDEKNSEVEKLRDLCLKQKEEIKSLKNAVLFPDGVNLQMQDLFGKQGLELQQAKQVIPSLQKQVSSLTEQLQCLAEGLAEVKAEQYTSSNSIERHNFPQTPDYNHERCNSLEFDLEGYETAEEDRISESSHVRCYDNGVETLARRMSGSSHYFFNSSDQMTLKRCTTRKSDESKYRYKYGKPMHHKLF